MKIRFSYACAAAALATVAAIPTAGDRWGAAALALIALCLVWLWEEACL